MSSSSKVSINLASFSVVLLVFCLVIKSPIPGICSSVLVSNIFILSSLSFCIGSNSSICCISSIAVTGTSSAEVIDVVIDVLVLGFCSSFILSLTTKLGCDIFSGCCFFLANKVFILFLIVNIYKLITLNLLLIFLVFFFSVMLLLNEFNFPFSTALGNNLV